MTGIIMYSIILNIDFFITSLIDKQIVYGIALT